MEDNDAGRPVLPVDDEEDVGEEESDCDVDVVDVDLEDILNSDVDEEGGEN